jgi:iron complex outermembrane receptor protein
LYGELNWKTSDKMTVTLGARYTQDEKSFVAREQLFVQQFLNPASAGPCSAFTCPIDSSFTWDKVPGGLMGLADFDKYPLGVVRDSRTWSSPTYRAMVSCRFDPDLYGYGQFGRGYKAGGYNDQIGTSGDPITTDELRRTNPEKADSFELGLPGKADHSWITRHPCQRERCAMSSTTMQSGQVVVPVTNASGPGR